MFKLSKQQKTKSEKLKDNVKLSKLQYYSTENTRDNVKLSKLQYKYLKILER